MTDPRLVQAREMIPVACEAPDDELLLADWLNALVHEIARRKMLFSRFQIRISNHRLSANVWGEKGDVARHEPAVEIKGATVTDLRVGPTDDGGWMAQCVVDV